MKDYTQAVKTQLLSGWLTLHYDPTFSYIFTHYIFFSWKNSKQGGKQNEFMNCVSQESIKPHIFFNAQMQSFTCISNMDNTEMCW